MGAEVVRTGRSRSLALLALSVAAGLTVFACQGNGLRRVRAVTYPPDFQYISQQEIRTTMGHLAVETVALEEIMQKRGGPADRDRQQVITILERMRPLVAKLDKGSSSNHPRLDRNIPRLRDDIDRALDDAQTLHPTYYRAGRVVGACTYCHVPRHERSYERVPRG